VQELLKQVEIIANFGQKNVRMPSSVKRVLGRAITARKRCATWFKRTDTANAFANDSHQYFIEVLEKAAASIVTEAEAKTSSSVVDEPKEAVDPMR
jgi:hypothetical protein